jgi:hypothetical protein
MNAARRIRRLVLAGLVGLGLSACTAPIEEALSFTLGEVTRIVDSEDLSAVQKRAALEALGVPPNVINALLSDQRLVNQFGGDLRSAYDKVVGDRLDALTPDEVQLYADAASEAGAGINLTLTDVQAQAMVDLFQRSHLSSRDQLLAFLEDPAQAATLSPDIPENALNDLFITLDPAEIVDQLP